MKTKPFILLLTALSTLNTQLSTVFAQGSLTPPGAPAPTMKSLAQVEPRTPISSLPFTITNAGSYYLVSNLTLVSGSFQDGITVSANNVTIDLEGFALVGSGSTGSGIVVPDIQTNLVVRNGTIQHWDYRGVDAQVYPSINNQFLHLQISDIGDCGLAAGENAIIRECSIVNALVGISTYDTAVIQDCSVMVNFDLGIYAGAGATVSDCSSLYNGGGIYAGTGSTVSRCNVRGNNGDGFVVDQSTIIECTAQANAGRGFLVLDGGSISRCTARVNTRDGILIDTGSQASQNTCELNGYSSGAGAGIRVTGMQNRIDGNHVVNNDFGIQVIATNNIIIRNSAEANGTNYVFTGPQIFGPTNNLVGAGGVITNLNPWANFSF